MVFSRAKEAPEIIREEPDICEERKFEEGPFDAPTEASDNDQTLTPPDGGIRAWLVVVGAFAGMAATFGVSNGTGTIQEYIASHQLSDRSESEIGWIFSLWCFFMYFGGIQTGPVFDAFGLKPLLLPGCALWCASLFILSVCKEYYQFILGFSILGGVSCSMVFNPCITVIGHWFKVKRSLATGLATTGGAVGGIYTPLMLNKLFGKLGFAWSIRVMAFISLGLCIFSCVTLDSRHIKRHVDWHEALIDVKSLRIPEFALCCAGVFLCEWAYFVPITYMVTYARDQGMTTDYSNALLAYMNIGSAVGRTIPGYFADKYGAYNVIVVVDVMTALTCLAIWIPAGHVKGGITAFAVLFGLFCGATISLTPICVASISNLKDYGKRYGTAYSIASLAVLTGVPIAGALTGHNYLGLKIFSGLAYLGAAAALALARWFAVRSKLIF